MARFGRGRTAWGLSTVLALGVGMALPVPQAQLDARTTAKKAAPKKPVLKKPVPLPPPPRKAPPPLPPVKQGIIQQRSVQGKAPPPVKGEPAIIVEQADFPPMAAPAPPEKAPPGKEGPQIKDDGTLHFSPTLAALNAEGWSDKEDARARLMLMVRGDGRVEDCKQTRRSPTAFGDAMCKLVVKSARFAWTGEGAPPPYGYLFGYAASQRAPDIDARLDFMPQDQGLPVSLRLWRDGECRVYVTAMPDAQEKALCEKLKRTLSARNDFGTNGNALDEQASDIQIWLRRLPAGAIRAQTLLWEPTVEAGFGR